MNKSRTKAKNEGVNSQSSIVNNKSVATAAPKRDISQSSPVPASPVTKPEQVQAIDNSKSQASARYIFPSSGKVCPRCRGANTEAYSTKVNIQYRRCRAPICRWNYSIRGTLA